MLTFSCECQVDGSSLQTNKLRMTQLSDHISSWWCLAALISFSLAQGAFSFVFPIFSQYLYCEMCESARCIIAQLSKPQNTQNFLSRGPQNRQWLTSLISLFLYSLGGQRLQSAPGQAQLMWTDEVGCWRTELSSTRQEIKTPPHLNSGPMGSYPHWLTSDLFHISCMEIQIWNDASGTLNEHWKYR